MSTHRLSTRSPSPSKTSFSVVPQSIVSTCSVWQPNLHEMLIHGHIINDFSAIEMDIRQYDGKLKFRKKCAATIDFTPEETNLPERILVPSSAMKTAENLLGHYTFKSESEDLSRAQRRYYRMKKRQIDKIINLMLKRESMGVNQALNSTTRGLCGCPLL